MIIREMPLRLNPTTRNTDVTVRPPGRQDRTHEQDLRPFPDARAERWRKGLQHRYHLDRQGKHHLHLTAKLDGMSLPCHSRSVDQMAKV